MTEYKVGQRVRVTDVYEGIITYIPAGSDLIRVGDWSFSPTIPASRMVGSDYTATRTIEVVRPPEPDGFAAVVEAAFQSPFQSLEQQRWVRIRQDRWRSEDGNYTATWEYLVDPVVLSEGM